ncbi:MAG: methyltransferase domain-containing protein [Calditrichaeota bacterium]|nr:MAG: methyltransferase domain-containing protein [Calditrichota bacterium]
MHTLKYDLILTEIPIAGRLFKVWRVRNLDELVDQVSEEQFDKDERLPYWAELWPSAQALAAFLLEHAAYLAGRSVLELGCGLGLTTMAAALCAPGRFVATDYEPDALAHCRRNFECNGLTPPEWHELDWRAPQLDETFDVLLASDVVYEQRFFEPLIRVFTRFLKPDGRILLAEPNRGVARGFFGKLAMAGFTFERRDFPVMQDGRTITVSIYDIQLSKKE